MIHLKDNRYLVETAAELPEINDDIVYIDFETTSFDDKMPAFYPYLGHRLLGIGITTEQSEKSYYVPLRHRNGKNVDLSSALSWLQKILERATVWINENVKFDAHFAWCEGIRKFPTLWDLNIASKLLDSDRFSHSLKPICRDWLNMPMEEEHRIKAYLKSARSKDYAVVPADVMGEYCCMDVIAAKALHHYHKEKAPPELQVVGQKEVQMTKVLFRMENKGFKIDRIKCLETHYEIINNIIKAQEIIRELTGVQMKSSNDCMYEIIVNQLGLPVLIHNDPTDVDEDETGEVKLGSPSFNKKAMALYKHHPLVFYDERKSRVIQLVSFVKKAETFCNLYLENFVKLADNNDRVHPDFNQQIRTGRMSCRHPNGQNLSARAKEFVIPNEGNSFACQDASQIEFRIIAHYCQIKEAIDSYKNNPQTDYHQWVADLCGILRPSAKTMNFLMAYGGGKEKAITQLSFDPDIIKAIEAEMDQNGIAKEDRPTTHLRRAREIGTSIYQTYHARLPEIRATSEAARALCAQRGYIKNIYGRRRHLPTQFSYRAFNSLNQGCAMDVIKERMIAIDDWLINQGVDPLLNVHDELLQEGPTEIVANPEFQAELKRQLEDVQAEFDVPFVWDCHYSSENWRKAKPGDKQDKAELETAEIIKQLNA